MGPETIKGAFARRAVRKLVRLYYPVIEVSGRDLIPSAGPVLFVANHANSLMDPVMIGIVSRRPVHFLAKAPLFDIPVFGSTLRALGMVPAYRGSDDASQVGGNLKSLANAAAYLVKGEAVGIFPEGKSHDALKVDKVRSGAARVAIQAAQDGASSLKIVSLGINYENKEKFRSSVWIRVGEPIDLRDWQERIGADERVAMRELTAEIDRRLKRVVIHLAEEKWEPYLSELESLVPPTGDNRKSPIAALRQRKRIADAVNHFLENDPQRATATARDVKNHRAKLKTAGLVMQSDLFRFRYAKLFLRQTWDFVWLLLGFIPALLGTIYNAVPFLAVRAVNWILPKPNRSTVALERLLLGIPIFGGWYAFLWFRLAEYFLPWVASVWSGAMLFAGAFVLIYWRRAEESGKLWWSELRMVTNPKLLEQFRREHIELRGRLQALAAEYRKLHPPEEERRSAAWNWFIWKRIIGWSVTVAILVAAASWTVSYIRNSQISVLQPGGLTYRQLTPETLSAILTEDEKALAEILRGLQDLESVAFQVKGELTAGKRGFYSQQDNDSIRRLMFTYLCYRTELLRLIWKYQNHAQAPGEIFQLRTFLVGLTAASALYETSFKFVTEFAQTPEAIRKLNEGEPLWQIPPGMYDMVRANLAAPKNRKLLEGARRQYHDSASQFTKHRLSEGNTYTLFHQTITQSEKTTADLAKISLRWNSSSPVEEAQKVGKAAVYRGQSAVSTWVGDTRVRQPRQGKPLIQPEQLEELRKILQPGDILLERQNWYLSRAFMPGYWAHAALYVGNTNDLVKLGLDKDPRVQNFWNEFAARDAQDHEHLILEAVPRGVRMTTLEHCLGVADSAAVLRPKIAADRLPEVIARAFIHLGKPYDFEFDFFSTDKLVCTELVYRSCGMEIDFPLVEVMGRKTLPPTEIVRMFVKERGPDAQLQFVTFLDGEESHGKARFKGEEEFAETIHRPSLTWLQKE